MKIGRCLFGKYSPIHKLPRHCGFQVRIRLSIKLKHTHTHTVFTNGTPHHPKNTTERDLYRLFWVLHANTRRPLLVRILRISGNFCFLVSPFTWNQTSARGRFGRHTRHVKSIHVRTRIIIRVLPTYTFEQSEHRAVSYANIPTTAARVR